MGWEKVGKAGKNKGWCEASMVFAKMIRFGVTGTCLLQWFFCTDEISDKTNACTDKNILEFTIT